MNADLGQGGGRYQGIPPAHQRTAPSSSGPPQYSAESNAAGPASKNNGKNGGLKQVLLDHKPLAALLVMIPFGFISEHFEWSRVNVFICNFFAILPMAWLIGKSTEDLGEVTSTTIAGLLNATFGNVVEMLLCIAGIRSNQLAVVQCTLVGSILSNLLLVMGTAFIVGGFRYKIQRFSKIGAGSQSSLLILAVLVLVLPTMYSQLVPGEQAILDISRGCSVMLLLVYIQFLVFQLKTHPELFEPPKDPPEDQDLDDSNDTANKSDDDEDDEAAMSTRTAIIVLGICTVLTACCSEYLINSIEETIVAWNVSKEFIGVIVLPIIGNAAEHYTAIVVAYKNEMDLSLGVAVGSSCQMALLVTPFTVLVGWYFDRDMSLDFHPFQVTVLLCAVLIVSNVLQDGSSNWLEGSMLTTAYASIATIYYFEDFALSSKTVYGHQY